MLVPPFYQPEHHGLDLLRWNERPPHLRFPDNDGREGDPVPTFREPRPGEVLGTWRGPGPMGRFAEGTGAWLGPVLAVLFAAGAAWLVARSVTSESAAKHGLVVGLVVGLAIAVVDLTFGGSFGVGALAGFVRTVGAGWLGGRLGKRGG
jgi:hypothetical protein